MLLSLCKLSGERGSRQERNHGRISAAPSPSSGSRPPPPWRELLDGTPTFDGELIVDSLRAELEREWAALLDAQAALLASAAKPVAGELEPLALSDERLREPLQLALGSVDAEEARWREAALALEARWRTEMHAMTERWRAEDEARLRATLEEAGNEGRWRERLRSPPSPPSRAAAGRGCLKLRGTSELCASRARGGTLASPARAWARRPARRHYRHARRGVPAPRPAWAHLHSTAAAAAAAAAAVSAAASARLSFALVGCLHSCGHCSRGSGGARGGASGARGGGRWAHTEVRRGRCFERCCERRGRDEGVAGDASRNLASLQLAYKDVDWADRRNWDCNEHRFAARASQ